MLEYILAAVLGYLIGSISFAIILTKIVLKDDIRQYGSGNAGTTNVLRTAGKLPALITIAGDVGKGILAVFVGGWICQLLGAGVPEYGRYIAGVFAFLGHLYPLYFGFKGGKGVATAAGVVLALNPLALLILLALFIVLVAISKYVSLGSMIAAACYPFVATLLVYLRGGEILVPFICSAVMAALVIYGHRSNIGRILNGTENKLSFKTKRGS